MLKSGKNSIFLRSWKLQFSLSYSMSGMTSYLTFFYRMH